MPREDLLIRPIRETTLMYKNFTDRASKAMQLGEKSARRSKHEYVATEHILLGVIEEGGEAAKVLRNLGVDPRKVREEAERIVQSGPTAVRIARKLPLSPRAKKSIEFALDEARNLGYQQVGTEHLLLGLLREQEGVAAHVLINLLLELPQVRTAVLSRLGHRRDAGAEGGTEVEKPNPEPT
jgi:ATP-dependent Clp protease ATP-binding subunit ClpC